MLDHLIIGCRDLDRAVATVETRTGVRAAFGGVHPGRGTRNALLGLGPRRYLEIVAPDPAQADLTQFPMIRDMAEPALVGWAADPGDIDALAARLRAARVSFDGPTPGSRARPDGTTLHWRTLVLADDADGLLPFFIEWNADSVHPSIDAPPGCALTSLAAATPDVDALADRMRLLGLDLPIERAERPALRATITGPRGRYDLTS